MGVFIELTRVLITVLLYVPVGCLIHNMVNNEQEVLNGIFQAFANRTRRAILLRLAESSCFVAELGQPFEMTAPAISRHLRVLEQAGVVVRSRDGQRQRICLARESIDRLRGFLAELETGMEHDHSGDSADRMKKRSSGALPQSDWDAEDDEWTKLL